MQDANRYAEGVCPVSRLFAPFVFIACFALMQRSLMGMIGLRYKDMLAIMKRRLGK